VGRRPLLLVSELGMALSQLAMGIYFYVLYSKKEDIPQEEPFTMANGTRTAGGANPGGSVDFLFSRWLPLPILAVYTIAYNVGMVTNRLKSLMLTQLHS
jgi:hypothetical protein